MKQPKNRVEAQDFLIELSKQWIAKGEEIFGYKLPRTSFNFNLGRSVMGTFSREGRIHRLSYNIANTWGHKQAWDHIVEVTVPHEVAHLIQRTNPQFPQGEMANPSHGRYWQLVMNEFGFMNPQPCYSGGTTAGVDSMIAQKTKTIIPPNHFRYSCPKHPEKIFALNVAKHHAMKKFNSGKGNCVYRCPLCRSTLIYNG